MKYEDIKPNTPRLVVEFKMVESDREKFNNEQFKWGIVGRLPLMTTIGYLIRIQAELAFKSPEVCPDMALVMVWSDEESRFYYFVHPSIPVDSLVGMLETVKLTLIGSTSQAQNNAKDSDTILGPDGRPMSSRRRW